MVGITSLLGGFGLAYCQVAAGLPERPLRRKVRRSPGSRLKQILQIGLLSLCGVGAAGCSVFRGGLTVLDEARARNEARITAQELKELEPGTPIRIHLADGTSVSGDYVAMSHVSDEQVLQVAYEGHTTDVPLSQVERIERQRRKYSIWPAFVFGAAVDATLLVILLKTGIGPGVHLNF